jgi:hypothetical protein
MNDLLTILLILALWFALNRYVLPRFGVKT